MENAEPLMRPIKARLVPAQCEKATALFYWIDGILKLIPDDYPNSHDLKQSLAEQQSLIFQTPADDISDLSKKVGKMLEDLVLFAPQLGQSIGKVFLRSYAH